ncbi:MAG: ribosome biogenesis GTPase YlqF [Candidatus Obscuribacterales bacterium]|nr:ribosome biogenesis GTPase YlqF [Candidatus Obscuribacterales bacterium]
MSKRATTPLQKLKEQLQAVDVLFEVRDARLPYSSGHPRIKELFGNKPRIIVLCKEDLADKKRLQPALKELAEKDGNASIALSLKLSKGKDRLVQLAVNLCKDKIESRRKKGLLDRPLRAAVVGLPNVGKSSLINWIAGKKKAQVANTPGVTRGNSWIRIHPQIDLLDTPGILPIASFKGDQATRLALCNILPSDQYDNDYIALWALTLLSNEYNDYLNTYRGDVENSTVDLERIAIARHCIKTGAVPDLQRASAVFLSELRAGKLGPVILESAVSEMQSIVDGDEMAEEPEREDLFSDNDVTWKPGDSHDSEE